MRSQAWSWTAAAAAAAAFSAAIIHFSWLQSRSVHSHHAHIAQLMPSADSLMPRIDDNVLRRHDGTATLMLSHPGGSQHHALAAPLTTERMSHRMITSSHSNVGKQAASPPAALL